MINAVKQAAEFGVMPEMRLAALFVQLSDIHALGLKAAQGLQLASAFYWDRTDGTRAFAKRFAERMNGRMPTENHAGVYSSTLAYLKAVRDTGTIEGEKVVAAMREKPIDDPLFGAVTCARTAAPSTTCSCSRSRRRPTARARTITTS